MKISRDEAIISIDEKILQFQRVLEGANYDNLSSDEYQLIRDEAEILLTDLLSEAEAKKFEGHELIKIVTTDPERNLQEYKEKIKQYIKKLVDYRDKIENFWFKGIVTGYGEIAAVHLIVFSYLWVGLLN